MPAKVLIMNGHSSKKRKRININAKHRIITPGDVKGNYTVSFDNSQRHLEEKTHDGFICPVTNTHSNTAEQWHRYQNTVINDISISPLQGTINLQEFAQSILEKEKTHPWSKLISKAHNVLQCGALAIKMPSGAVVIYEKQELTEFLTRIANSIDVTGTPMFFCDKELGKVKPLGTFIFSEIYAAIDLIPDFTEYGTDIIIATCNMEPLQLARKSDRTRKASGLTVVSSPKGCRRLVQTNFKNYLSHQHRSFYRAAPDFEYIP
ncbi:MAG: hypothetical protein ACRCXC_13730 [Legionella sp.]